MPKTARTRASVAKQLVIDTPPAELLAPMARKVTDARLTKKQREFAQAIVDGETGAAAYRRAYNSTGKPQTQAQSANELKNNPKIAQTIEALKRAKELSESLSAAQIRALILSDLLKHSQDEDQKLSDRLAALKLLGTLSDVQAYTERKEVLNIKASVDIKQQLLEKLKLIGSSATPEASSNTKQAESEQNDGDSLLAELSGDIVEGEIIEDLREQSMDNALSFEPEADSVQDHDDNGEA